MTMVAGTIIDAAARELFDVDNIRWSRTELMGFLNEALRQITVLQPEAAATTANVTLVPGCKQSIPVDGWTLLDVLNNVSAGGDARRAVRTVSRQLLNGFNPDWPYDPQATEVVNVVFDKQDRTHFWVYPPNDGTGILNLNYAAIPATVTSEAAALVLNDTYYTPLLEYVLFRACSKTAPWSPGPVEAARHFQLFTATLAAEAEAADANSVNAPGATS